VGNKSTVELLPPDLYAVQMDIKFACCPLFVFGLGTVAGLQTCETCRCQWNNGDTKQWRHAWGFSRGHIALCQQIVSRCGACRLCCPCCVVLCLFADDWEKLEFVVVGKLQYGLQTKLYIISFVWLGDLEHLLRGVQRGRFLLKRKRWTSLGIFAYCSPCLL
jgi:hypothetical protein